MWTNLFGTDQAKKKKKTSTHEYDRPENTDEVKEDVSKNAKKSKKCKPRKKRTLPVALTQTKSAAYKQRQKKRKPNPVRYLYV